MAFTQISGDGLKNNSITNAHLHSGANIAASKLADSGVTAGSYGSASLIPAITVNAQGLVTSLSTNSFTTTDNNFTDDLLSKLNGIANNANNVTNYVKDDNSDILAGDTYTFLSSVNQKIVLSGASNPFIRFQEGTTDKAYIQWNADGYLRLRNEEAQDELRVANGNNGLQFVIDGTARNVFHAGNSNFVTADASDELSGDTYTFSGSSGQKIILNGATNPYIHFHEGTTAKAYIQWNSDGYLELHNQETSEAIKIASGSNGLLFRHGGTDKTVWHSGNSNFVTADASDTLTGATYTFSNAESQKIILSGATNPYIRFQEGTTNKAYIQWDSAGYFLMVNQESGEHVRIGSGNNGLQFVVDGTARNVLHSGNVSTYALPISGGTLTGDLITDDLIVGNGSGQTRLFLQKADNNVSDHIIFYNGTARVGEIGVEDGSWLRLNQETATNIYTPRLFRSDGGFQVGAGTDIQFTNGSSWSGNHTKIQHHSNYLYIVGGANGIIFREGGTSRWYIDGNGHLYPNGTNNYNIGNSNNRVNNIYGGALFLGQASRYLSNASADYGSVQINGSGQNGWEGFSIDGRAVFMHNGSSDTGIYNDVNNEWMLYCGHNSTTIMYFNGAQRIRTESYGARMNGTFRPNTTNSSDLGASDARWATFYVVNQPNVSDRNEKNTIKDSDLGLDFINKLRGVSFKWNDTKLGTKTRYGLIVQEVEEAIKEIGKNPDDIGLIDKPEKGAMGLCVSELIAPLVKAIQELSAKVAALEAS